MRIVIVVDEGIVTQVVADGGPAADIDVLIADRDVPRSEMPEEGQEWFTDCDGDEHALCDVVQIVSDMQFVADAYEHHAYGH